MHQSDIVVAGDDVSQSGQPLLHPLDPDCLRQTVPDVLQLLVGGVVGHQEAVTVPCSQRWLNGVLLDDLRGGGASLTDAHPPNDATACNGGVDHRDGF